MQNQIWVGYILYTKVKLLIQIKQQGKELLQLNGIQRSTKYTIPSYKHAE